MPFFLRKGNLFPLYTEDNMKIAGMIVTGICLMTIPHQVNASVLSAKSFDDSLQVVTAHSSKTKSASLSFNALTSAFTTQQDSVIKENSESDNCD